MSLFTNKTLLITGGTGSFGNAVLNRFLKTDIGEIRIFSREAELELYLIWCPAPSRAQHLIFSFSYPLSDYLRTAPSTVITRPAAAMITAAT